MQRGAPWPPWICVKKCPAGEPHWQDEAYRQISLNAKARPTVSLSAQAQIALQQVSAPWDASLQTPMQGPAWMFTQRSEAPRWARCTARPALRGRSACAHS